MSIYQASQLRFRTAIAPSRYHLDLYRDLTWVGHCLMENDEIAECWSIQLGTSGAETDTIFNQIQTAIQEGHSFILVDGHRFSWQQCGRVKP